ncbi:MAG: BatD family protein [Planctomycetota bacterium]|nr:BatD family protein [Planctomycetota bacterium]
MLCLCVSVSSQEIKVKSSSGLAYVGTPVTLEIEAINFETEPTIEIKGTEQPGVTSRYIRSGSSQSTQIYQSGGKMVRSTVVKTTFYYQVEFANPGEFEIGPFEAKAGGKTYSRPKVSYLVKDVEVSKEMEIAIEISPGNQYPGQRVPVNVVWSYAGDVDRVRGLTIRSPLFAAFQFIDPPVRPGQSGLPISTPGGVQEFPATFERKEVNGQLMIVGTVKRVMLAQNPGKTTAFPVYATFQKVTGYRRSNDVFSFGFDQQPVTVPRKAVGQPVEVWVKNFPPNEPETFNGAVGSGFSISASLNRTKIQVGDPLTLQVNIRGNGNIEAISLPKLEADLPGEDFDWPTEEASGVTNGDQKQFKISLRIKKESVTAIPALRFSWFDPGKEKYFTAQSEPIAMEVKKGQLVSSNDVVRNVKPLEFNPDKTVSSEAAVVDLSIETDVSKLLREKTENRWLPWFLYASGLCAIAIAVIDRYRRRVPSELQVRQSRVAVLCREIEALELGERFLPELAIKLRELQNLQAMEGLAGSMTRATDRLISRCDALSFRPVAASPEEQRELYDLATAMVSKK